MARGCSADNGGNLRPTRKPWGDREEVESSDETIGIYGVAGHDAQHESVVQLSDEILTFALDCVVGTPLRFSAIMVEVFCLDRAPRRIAMDGNALTLLPDVLTAWIRFAGRRRGIPQPSIQAAVDAAYELAPEMIELSQDPDEWDLAKTVELAIRQRGIDMTDRQALDDFFEEVNTEGGIDVLAASLAGFVTPTR